jgi:hypothetical protein
MAAQRLAALGRHTLGRGPRTATARGRGQDGHLRARQRALAPVVDGLPTDTRQGRDLAERLPLGPPQHGLYARQEACRRGTLSRCGASRDLVRMTTQFCWALRHSHRAIVNVRSAYFKKLLLTHSRFAHF